MESAFPTIRRRLAKISGTIIMFISCKNDSWDEYELTDSEFGTVLGKKLFASWFPVGVALAVIQEYSRRNLNVAANLAVAFNWYSKNGGLSVQETINYNKTYNHLFSQYEKDLQKYLVLL
jgi:hypothetical protein